MAILKSTSVKRIFSVVIGLATIPSITSSFQINESALISSANKLRVKSPITAFARSPSKISRIEEEDESRNRHPPFSAQSKKIISVGSSLLLSAAILTSSIPALAVSGGGLDYAGLDLSNQDFSNGNYKGKDFSQVIAKGTTFAKSNLIGCRFFKAYLVNADFTGADLRGASLEDTSMDDASLKNANVAGAYFSASLFDVKTLENADFTDAQLPPKLLDRICNKENFAFGTNPSTGVDTRESLMCL